MFNLSQFFLQFLLLLVIQECVSCRIEDSLCEVSLRQAPELDQVHLGVQPGPSEGGVPSVDAEAHVVLGEVNSRVIKFLSTCNLLLNGICKFKHQVLPFGP